MKSTDILWTEADIATLKTEWEKGTYARQIGFLVNRTKNSVIGKAHRLKLEDRNHSHGPYEGRPKKERPPRAPRPKMTKTKIVVNKLARKPTFYPPAVPLTTKPPISIMELNEDTCRAPVGRGDNGLVTYCGDFTFPGQSWCPAHCAIYFAPPNQRKRVR